MRKFLIVAAAVAAFTAPASARDYWNSSGYSLDHNFHSRYDSTVHLYVHGGSAAAPTSIDGPSPPTSAQRATEKAVEDQRRCAPVVLYTDTGRVTQPALGCSK